MQSTTTKPDVVCSGIVSQMRSSAGMAAAFLRTLANEDRLLLLCQLTEGEACVNELEKLVDIQQPTLSQQLGVLRKEQLVDTRREGKHVYYSIRPGPALQFLDMLYQNFCREPSKGGVSGRA